MKAKPRIGLAELSIHGRWIRWVAYLFGYSRTELALLLDRSLSTLATYSMRPTDKRFVAPPNETWHKLAELAEVTHAQYHNGPPSSVPDLVTAS